MYFACAWFSAIDRLCSSFELFVSGYGSVIVFVNSRFYQTRPRCNLADGRNDFSVCGHTGQCRRRYRCHHYGYRYVQTNRHCLDATTNAAANLFTTIMISVASNSNVHVYSLQFIWRHNCSVVLAYVLWTKRAALGGPMLCTG